MNPRLIKKKYRRTQVYFEGNEEPGTLVVDPDNRRDYDPTVHREVWDATLARQPHGVLRIARRRAAAGLRDPVGLPGERTGAGKGSRVIDLQPHGGAPPLGHIGTTMPGRTT